MRATNMRRRAWATKGYLCMPYLLRLYAQREHNEAVAREYTKIAMTAVDTIVNNLIDVRLVIVLDAAINQPTATKAKKTWAESADEAALITSVRCARAVLADDE